MLVSPFRSLRVRLIASVVIIEIVMLSLLVWSNMGVIQQAYGDRLRDTAAGMLQQIATTSGGYMLEVDYATLGEYLNNIAGHEENPDLQRQQPAECINRLFAGVAFKCIYFSVIDVSRRCGHLDNPVFAECIGIISEMRDR